VTDYEITSHDCTTTAAAAAAVVANSDDDNDGDVLDADNGYYRIPLSAERIFWVDSSEYFHSCVDLIASVNKSRLSCFYEPVTLE